MSGAPVGLGLALLAGLASFLSPCVFSLVPAYVGYLAGRAAGGEAGSRRLVTLMHGVAFVLGFTAVFVALGAVVGATGGLLQSISSVLAQVGGVVVVVFGLHMIGVFRIPFLEYDARVHRLPDPKWGYASSALLGVFFSAGWSPCVGPVLGTILTFALKSGSAGVAAVLLTAYSAGLAIPFLAAALGIGWVTNILRKYSKAMHYVEMTMGGVLVIVGIMLFAGVFELMARYGLYIDFGI